MHYELLKAQKEAYSLQDIEEYLDALGGERLFFCCREVGSRVREEILVPDGLLLLPVRA